MNYRHGFHAGNFADAFKHAVLARLLLAMGRKEAPFRVIETHAGAGLYDLAGSEAERTGEWLEGLGRVLDADFSTPVQDLLKPWLETVSAEQGVAPSLYPGSPVLAQRLTRPGDRLIFCESQPEVAAALQTALGRDRRAKVLVGDGWGILPGLVPPPERRGLVLIDPPFEREREFAAIVEGVQAGLRRWAQGTYVIWYPIKGRREVDHFARKLAGLKAPGAPMRIVRAELALYRIERVDRLNGCGLAIVNPPWQVDREIAVIGAALGPVLAREGEGAFRLEELGAGV